ncbi:hypothetical protein B0A54_14139 [Friedmanniomyces endolithicus]|uniref:Uncharacterized protein n=1 Tax=Friedmanniomyces endolithicus TaxID=329885 RepID=A0A4U0UI61_9PEZI|nr:hypothetical protein B0A54_14139 [Friedmanniomyces endolithicus]
MLSNKGIVAKIRSLKELINTRFALVVTLGQFQVEGQEFARAYCGYRARALISLPSYSYSIIWIYRKSCVRIYRKSYIRICRKSYIS